jgi:hypothetical protein
VNVRFKPGPDRRLHRGSRAQRSGPSSPSPALRGTVPKVCGIVQAMKAALLICAIATPFVAYAVARVPELLLIGLVSGLAPWAR